MFIFVLFLITILKIQTEKSIDSVLGIQTRCGRMVGADKTTELWLPQNFHYNILKLLAIFFHQFRSLQTTHSSHIVIIRSSVLVNK